MTHTLTPVDLSGLSDAEYLAIENEAKERGVSFDEAFKQMIKETSQRLQKRSKLTPIARLFRFPSAR
jgi:flagellar hook-basal body complex protein FliE